MSILVKGNQIHHISDKRTVYTIARIDNYTEGTFIFGRNAAGRVKSFPLEEVVLVKAKKPRTRPATPAAPAVPTCPIAVQIGTGGPSNQAMEQNRNLSASFARIYPNLPKEKEAIKEIVFFKNHNETLSSGYVRGKGEVEKVYIYNWAFLGRQGMEDVFMQLENRGIHSAKFDGVVVDPNNGCWSDGKQIDCMQVKKGKDIADNVYVIKSDDGQTLACVWNNNILVSFDFIHTDDTRAFDKVLTYILKSYLNPVITATTLTDGVNISLLKPSSVEIDRSITHLKTQAKQIEDLLKNCSETNKVGYMKKLAELSKSIRDKSENKKLLEKIDPIKDLKALKKSKLIDNYAFPRPHVLRITTKPVKAKAHGSNKKYILGRYHIQVNLINKNLNIFNEYLSSSTEQHPHIQSSGNCCTGNMGQYLMEFFGTKDVTRFVNYAMVYLSRINPESTYQPITYFVQKLSRAKKALRAAAATTTGETK